MVAEEVAEELVVVAAEVMAGRWMRVVSRAVALPRHQCVLMIQSFSQSFFGEKMSCHLVSWQMKEKV